MPIFIFMNIQILKDRPFNLADGSRKLIVCQIKGADKVFTRSYKDKPVFSSNFLEAKTYQDQKALDKALTNIFDANEYEYKIYQVSDLMEPRYYIRYREKNICTDPDIQCYNIWVLKGSDKKATYRDYEEAKRILERSKCELIEFYYSKIMEMRNLVVQEIKTGA
jgi:hypothetical protein